MRTVLLAIALALGLPGSAWARQSPSEIDLSIERGSYTEPDSPYLYSFYIRNLSDRDASGVRVSGTLPASAIFLHLDVDHDSSEPPVRCETPPHGETGLVEVRLGRIRAGSLAGVVVTVQFTDPPGADAALTFVVDSDQVEANPSNNSFTHQRVVPAPEAPPAIERARSVRDPEAGFTIVVEGSNFDDAFGEVGIGCDCTPWSQAAFRSTTEVVLYGGSDLRAKFPKGVPVRICIFNFNGARSVVEFTRR